MLGSLRSPRAPHIQPLSATRQQQAAGPCSARYARLARPISSHYQPPSTMSSISTITATIRQQQAAGSRQMLGSLRSPRAPHIQPLSATRQQQAAGPCSARYARLARPISSHYQPPSGSSIPTVRHCPRPPPSRARSFLAVCANDCAWIIIHFGFSVLDNYSFLPLRGYKR